MIKLAKRQLRININIKKQLITDHQQLRRKGLDKLKKYESITRPTKRGGNHR
jgi:hypothetical protein